VLSLCRPSIRQSACASLVFRLPLPARSSLEASLRPLDPSSLTLDRPPPLPSAARSRPPLLSRFYPLRLGSCLPRHSAAVGRASAGPFPPSFALRQLLPRSARPSRSLTSAARRASRARSWATFSARSARTRPRLRSRSSAARSVMRVRRSRRLKRSSTAQLASGRTATARLCLTLHQHQSLTLHEWLWACSDPRGV
jgi:hypothetical protein